MSPNYKQERLDQLRDTYRVRLRKERLESPKLYSWPIEELDEIVSRVMETIEEKGVSFIAFQGAIRLSTKSLCGKATSLALENFLKGE